MEVAEAMSDFFTYELTSQSVLDFMQKFDFGSFEVVSEPMSASRMVLVHGNADCTFTSGDIEWLACAHCVIMGKLDKKANIFAMDIECDSDEYYINCAALIKIFNIAFPGSNVYLFRIGQAMALGSMRTFSVITPNNFCITALIDASNINRLAELIHDLSLAEIDDLPEICMNYSPQENGRPNKVYRSNIIESFNEKYYDEEQMDDATGIYGGYGFWRIEEGLDENDSNLEIECYTYKQVCSLLNEVATSGDSSSYDDLDVAREAEETARVMQMHFVAETSDIDDDTEESGFVYSNEALLNAETLLNEMQQKAKPIDKEKEK